MKNKFNDKKNAIWNTIGTTLNAFNSLFFMIIAIRINGTDSAGIFTYAFSISALFNIIGVYYGRVYQVTESSRLTDSDFFGNKLLTCIFMLLLSILFILCNSYNLEKGLIIFVLSIYRTLEAFAEVLYAYYQKNNELYKVGISLVVKNLLGLFLFGLVDYLTKSILYSTIILTINYFVIMLLYDMQAIKKYKINILKMNKSHVASILKQGFLPFLLAFFLQLLLNIPRYIIDLKTPSESAIWGIIIMPASIMILIGQFSLAPFIMELFELYSNHEIKKYLAKVKNICLFVLGGGIIGVICAWLFGIPVLNFVYGIDLDKYRMSLLLIILGAILSGLQNILYNLLVAMRYIKVQVYIYLMCIILAFFLFYFLIDYHGVWGASVAYLLIMGILFLIYAVIFLIYSKRNGGYSNGES